LIDKHFFVAEYKKTNWKQFLYFDLETVENIEVMKKLKESNKLDENYLNPLNCKYVAFGVFNKFIKSDEFIDYSVFKKEVKKDYTIYYNIKELSFKEIALTLLEFVVKNELKGFVAYNGNNFDFNIFTQVENVKTKRIKNTLVFYYGGKTITTIDLIELARATVKSNKTLDNFAKTFNVQSKNLHSATNIYEYVINDVEIMLNLVKKFINLQLEKTATATGRKRIVEILKNTEFERIVSKSYIFFDYAGGRTDIFKTFAKSCNVFDANSLYPSVMSNFLFPKVNKINNSNNGYILDFNKFAIVVEEKIKNFLETLSLNDFKDFYVLKQKVENFIKNDYGYILYVKIIDVKKEFKHMESILLRYFQFSFKDEDGKRVFTFNRNEIYQIEFYNIVFLKFYEFEVVKAIAYKCDKYIFADFYKEVYKKRKEYKKIGDKKELLLKIEMNSSYGILGMRSNKVENKNISYNMVEKFITDNSELVEIINVKRRLINNSYEKGVAVLVKPSKNIFFITENKQVYTIGKTFDKLTIPIYAILITSHARFVLNSVILMLILTGYEVYYCDTDSVFTNAPEKYLKNKGLIGNNLLQWKFEKSYKNFIAFAPKTYVATDANTGETIFKAKGTGSTLKRTIVINNYKLNKFGVLEERLMLDVENSSKYKVNNEFYTSYNKEKLAFKEAFKHVLLLAQDLYKNIDFSTLYN